jgi:hypothetical protein|tara:strand:+ start:800 stop:1270 length:471 start_codon:yes stop_codon:yes gene_type:complete
MSNRGITAFYTILDTIKDKLLDDINVNTVTTGDITEIDLSKQTIFPLSHIIINSVTPQDQVLNFNITIMSMDIVDINKENKTDIFTGNNNEHDVLNSQLAVLNRLIVLLRGGTLYRDRYQLDGDPSCEPFYERFENQLAGWACTMNILIENNVSNC